MAASLSTGWTAASLLPSLAAGFSPGSSVGSKLAPAQVSGNPLALKPALAQSPAAGDFRADLMRRILGQTAKADPMIPKAPGANPAVNSLSDIGFQYPSLLSRL